MLECGQPKTHQIQSHGGEPRGLSIISTSKKQRKFFGIHHRISAHSQLKTFCPKLFVVLMLAPESPKRVTRARKRLLVGRPTITKYFDQRQLGEEPSEAYLHLNAKSGSLL
jgi:hypothetical protein